VTEEERSGSAGTSARCYPYQSISPAYEGPGQMVSAPCENTPENPLHILCQDTKTWFVASHTSLAS